MTLNHPVRPKLRSLDPKLLEYKGDPSILLRDPLQLEQNTLLIPQALAPLLVLCDGSRSHEEISAAMHHHFSLPVDVGVIDHFIGMFDEMLLLENERSSAMMEAMLEAYRLAPQRPATLAGNGYPADPGELYRLLQNYLDAATCEPDRRPGRGLLSPHIDYRRGGPIYAEVWKRASLMIREADLVLIFGTDHYGGEQPITLTRQNYATPCGVLPTDQRVVDELAAEFGEDMVFGGELYHRIEHSIELVSVWLLHLREQKPVPIVPILTGPFAEQILGGQPMDAAGFVDRLVGALDRSTRDRKVFTVISGDLSHVGPAFNGAPLDTTRKRRILAEDHQLIDSLKQGDSQTFLETIQHWQDKNSICGTIPIYLAMQLLPRARGELIAYAQCPADEQETSIVSIAGMIYH